MSLASGSRLGHYEVLAPLGAGGVSEVYRARDSKLNRDVALKLLPEAFTADTDRLARFKREAQVLASLNHPNIAAIFGLEDSAVTHALVMELVEGEDLSALIARGPMAPADALPLARQIAAALEAAHGQGIIHRATVPGTRSRKAAARYRRRVARLPFCQRPSLSRWRNHLRGGRLRAGQHLDGGTREVA